MSPAAALPGTNTFSDTVARILPHRAGREELTHRAVILRHILCLADAAQLQLFHDRLYAATRARIPDRRALLFRMKEAWRYLGCSFADAERPLRRIRKAQDLAEYESAVRQLFASCPVREDAGYFV